MTLRARPVARRRGRAGWDPGDRRNSLINLGFFLAIGLSVLILIGYAAWSWYDELAAQDAEHHAELDVSEGVSALRRLNA